MQSAFLQFLDGLDKQRQKNIDRQLQIGQNNARNALLFRANQRADEEYKYKQDTRKANNMFTKAYLNPDSRDVNSLMPQSEWDKATLTPEEVKATQGVDITDNDALKKSNITGNMLRDIMAKAKAQLNISNAANTLVDNPKYGLTELERNQQAAKKVADAGLELTSDIATNLKAARAAQITAINNEKNSLAKQIEGYTKNIGTDMRALLKSNSGSKSAGSVRSNTKGIYYKDADTGKTIFVPKENTNKKDKELFADFEDRIAKKISPKGVGIDASNLRDLIQTMRNNNYSENRIKYLINSDMDESAGGFGLHNTELGKDVLNTADQEYLRMHPDEDPLHHYKPVSLIKGSNEYQDYMTESIINNKNKINTLLKKLTTLNTNPAEAKRDAITRLFENALKPVNKSTLGEDLTTKSKNKKLNVVENHNNTETYNRLQSMLINSNWNKNKKLSTVGNHDNTEAYNRLQSMLINSNWDKTTLKPNSLINTQKRNNAIKMITTALEKGPSDILEVFKDPIYLKNSGLTNQDKVNITNNYYDKHGFMPNSLGDRLRFAGKAVKNISESIGAKTLSGLSWFAELPQDAAMNLKDIVTGKDSYNSATDGIFNQTRKDLDKVSNDAINRMTKNNSIYSQDTLNNMATIGSFALTPGTALKTVKYAGKLPIVGKYGAKLVNSTPGINLTKRILEKTGANTPVSKLQKAFAIKANKQYAEVFNNVMTKIDKLKSPKVNQFIEDLQNNFNKSTSMRKTGMGYNYMAPKDFKYQTIRSIKKFIKENPNMSEKDVKYIEPIVKRLKKIHTIRATDAAKKIKKAKQVTSVNNISPAEQLQNLIDTL